MGRPEEVEETNYQASLWQARLFFQAFGPQEEPPSFTDGKTHWTVSYDEAQEGSWR